MASEKKIPLFARPASGLVRELSATKATFFNVNCATGWNASFSITFVATYLGTGLVLGVALWLWMWFLALPFVMLYGLCFVWLVSSVPRSGGDYIYTSRIMHPYLGWIESFMLVVGLWSVFGANLWQTMYNIKGIFQANALLFPESGWAWWMNWLNQPMNFFIGGLPFYVALVLLYMMRPAKLYSVVMWITLLSVISLPIFALSMVGVTPQSFSVNFVRLTGQDVATVMANAQNAGYVSGQPAGFQTNNLFLLWTWILLLYLGYTWSTYLAGELKGNVARNVWLSILIPVVANFLYTGPFPILFMNAIGYDFASAWAWMTFISPGSLPAGTPPLVHVVAIIAHPELWAVFTFASLFFAVLPVLILAFAWGYLPSRIIFAWSMDRMAPTKLTEINKRTRQPLYATLLSIFWGILFYWWSVMGQSPLNTLWFLTLVTAPTWIFPTLNCILLPYRRPELYARAAWRYKVGGVPVVVLVGLVTFLAFGGVYGGAYFYPIISQLMGTPSSKVYDFLVSSGLMPTIIVFVVGTVYYVGARWIQARRGIDTSLIYKSVPPE